MDIIDPRCLRRIIRRLSTTQRVELFISLVLWRYRLQLFAAACGLLNGIVSFAIVGRHDCSLAAHWFIVGGLLCGLMIIKRARMGFTLLESVAVSSSAYMIGFVIMNECILIVPFVLALGLGTTAGMCVSVIATSLVQSYSGSSVSQGNR